MRICRVATVPFFFRNHLYNQIIATIHAGHSVTLVCGHGEEINQLEKIPGITVHLIEIRRTIKPVKDILALVRLYKYFRQNQFDIIHSTTPKAGLLSAIAGIWAGIPIRIHTFTGQPWVELHGLARYLVKACDWLTAHLNTLVYADSFSQCEFLITEGVVSKNKISVIGPGSLAGVDINRFDKQKYANQIPQIRAQIGIPENANVISYIGRLTKDKGIAELVEAFYNIHAQNYNCVLLLIGPRESERDSLTANTLKLIQQNKSIYQIGYSSSPELYLAISDIICLPSYREGFGNVIIEAAAMGVPAVATDIVGLRDAVQNHVTGLLVKTKNVSSLTSALERLLIYPIDRLRLGNQAMERARGKFDSQVVNLCAIEEYSRLARIYLKSH